MLFFFLLLVSTRHSLHFSSDQGSFNSGILIISRNNKRSMTLPTWDVSTKMGNKEHMATGKMAASIFLFKTDSTILNQKRTYGAKNG